MVKGSCRTSEGQCFTDLVIEVFRLNGRLVTAGDRLTRDLGLTSARWQVMGAIREKPLSVAQIARNMGLTRQSVQRIVNALCDEEFVDFQDNPDHQRSKLINLSKLGVETLAKVTVRQIEWANRVSENLSSEQISKAVDLLQILQERVDT